MDKDSFNKLVYSDEQIDDELIDALIKAGAHEHIQNSTLEILDGDLSDIEFSEELDRNLLKYFNELDKSDKSKKIIKFTTKAKNIAIRAAAVLFVLIALTVGFVATSEATQLKLLHMYIEHSDVDTSFRFENQDEPNVNNPERQTIDSLETILWYIPMGFESVYEDHSSNIKIIKYENFDGGYIDISQISKGHMRIDNEGATSYTIEVEEYVCIVFEDDDRNTVICEIDGLSYSIVSNISVDEIIKIIKGINY